MNGNNDGHNNREYTNIIEERNNRKNGNKNKIVLFTRIHTTYEFHFNFIKEINNRHGFTNKEKTYTTRKEFHNIHNASEKNLIVIHVL